MNAKEQDMIRGEMHNDSDPYPAYLIANIREWERREREQKAYRFWRNLSYLLGAVVLIVWGCIR